jgi:hypothetical protein
MLTGTKQLSAHTNPIPTAGAGKPMRAAVLVILAAAIVYWIAR